MQRTQDSCNLQHGTDEGTQVLIETLKEKNSEGKETKSSLENRKHTKEEGLKIIRESIERKTKVLKEEEVESAEKMKQKFLPVGHHSVH